MNKTNKIAFKNDSQKIINEFYNVLIDEANNEYSHNVYKKNDKFHKRNKPWWNETAQNLLDKIDQLKQKRDLNEEDKRNLRIFKNRLEGIKKEFDKNKSKQKVKSL